MFLLPPSLSCARSTRLRPDRASAIQCILSQSEQVLQLTSETKNHQAQHFVNSACRSFRISLTKQLHVPQLKRSSGNTWLSACSTVLSCSLCSYADELRQQMATQLQSEAPSAVLRKDARCVLPAAPWNFFNPLSFHFTLTEQESPI